MWEDDSLRHVVRDLSQLLEWQAASGVDMLPLERVRAPIPADVTPPQPLQTPASEPAPRAQQQRPPAAMPPAMAPKPGETLEDIRRELGTCTRCSLHEGRKQIVFGIGNPRAELVIVGEAPGRNEDITGEPFVGRAGKLLNRMLEAIGLKRDQVYIANVIKCRPPKNRDPVAQEIATCSPFLHRQLKALNPRVLMTVGRFASQNIIGSEESMGRLRTSVREVGGVKVVATYHPAYLLRNPKMKRAAWEDLLKVRALLRGE